MSEPPTSEDEIPVHNKKRPFEHEDDREQKGTKKFSKYSEDILNELIIPDIGQKQKIYLPKTMHNKFWETKFAHLTSLAVSSSSWKSRLASFHKLKKFSEDTNTSIEWPLKQNTINGFIIWCSEKNEITANTTKTYLCHLNSIQKLMGFKKFKLNKYKNLIRGFQIDENLNKKRKNTRETIDFEALKKIKGEIFNQNTCKLFKKSLWAACSIAFFGCFRMGELVPKLENSTDKNFDLLWGDIELGKKHASIKLKSQKNNILKSQYIHIFKFKDDFTCPIKALKKLKKQAIKMDIFSKKKPVFKTGLKKNLTQRKINTFLKTQFPKNRFSGHSFRAGVPSSLADFPNIANDWHVMGWGRWRSSIFLKYQNRTKKQSKWVFKKIEKALL